MNPIEDESQQEIMVDTGGSFTNPALEIQEEEDNQLSSQHHHHNQPPYHHPPPPPPHPLHSPPQSPPQPPPPFMVDPATGPRSPQSQTSNRQEDDTDIYGGSITSGVLV